MNVKLRDPNIIMKLSRLGSFHQSRLSFLRSFLSEFKDWDYKKDLFDLDEKGYGTAIYSFKKNDRVYSLVCFANKIDDNERSDRVIATKWDAAFTLHDGVPLKKDIERLRNEVPKQPQWFEDARGVKNLELGLKKIGFSDTETNGVLGNNWYDFYKGIN